MAMLNWQGWAATNFVGWGSVGTTPPPVVVVPEVGGGKPRRKRHYLEIDGQYFEVKDEKDAIRIVNALNEAAREAAPKAVAEAVAKAPKAKPEPVVPKLAVVKPDYRQEFVQQLQAQVDAANARIAEIYRAAVEAELVAAAQIAKRAADEEDELVTLIMLGIL